MLPPALAMDPRRLSMRRRAMLLVACVFFACGTAGCARDEPRPPAIEPPPTLPNVGDTPVLAPLAAQDAPAPRRVVPAFRRDLDYAQDVPVLTRRLVYRVVLGVPKSLGTGHDDIARQAAELAIDVSADRLRARFATGAWPVPLGSELRLRVDAQGSYIFDGEGGRPLGPGQLANWFEGGALRITPRVVVRMPDEEHQEGPGRLVCRLIAEWAGVKPDPIVRRCGPGGAPRFFRIGLWRAERTADVVVEVPARALRADHLDPPPPAIGEDAGEFLSAASFRRLRRVRGDRAELAEDPPTRGLVVTNAGRTRLVVTARGTQIGWLGPGARHHFRLIPVGVHRIGGMRPFGLQAARSRPVAVPGRLSLPRWRRPPREE